MDKEKHIIQQVESTFESIESIKEVTISPFFKGKMMNRLFVEKESTSIFEWFTPKYQFATLVCILVLNTFALIEYNKQDYNENVSNFAQTYELSVNEEESIFN